MPIIIKTEQEIKAMRESGRILGNTLNKVIENAKPGISTLELDQIAEEYIKSQNALPAFKGHHGFTGTICAARNEVVVHGIPKADDILEEGDLFTVDCGVIVDGMITDAARSITVGKSTPEREQLVETAKLALKKALKICKPGVPVNKIGKTIEETVKKAGYKVIHDLTGHGVGKSLHEDPVILNYYEPLEKAVLKEGMTLAIEPIFALTTHDIYTLKDGWTIVTEDNSDSVQQEETVLITKNGVEILSRA